MNNIKEKILQAVTSTQANLYERQELSKLIWMSIGADLNILMLGDPGTAKTMLAVNLTETIKDAKIFRYTLNSFTTIDEIFGHFDLLKLKNNNELRRNITNKLLDCHIAYLDEFFKSNSGTLNALLDVMNEKAFIDSYGRVELPLKFLISSSNELPSEEDNLNAVLDRFQVKYLVKSMQDHSVRINAYLQSGNAMQKITAQITLEDIDLFRAEVAKVQYTTEVAEMTEKIYQSLAKENIFVSDRTIIKSIPLVKANAFLAGREQVEPSDLIVLKDVFWGEVSDIKPVKKIIFELANPLYGKVEEICESIQETIEEEEKKIKKSGSDPGEVANLSFEMVKKMQHASNSIQKIIKDMENQHIETYLAKEKVNVLADKISGLFGVSGI